MATSRRSGWSSPGSRVGSEGPGFAPGRQGAWLAGIDLDRDPQVSDQLVAAIEERAGERWNASPPAASIAWTSWSLTCTDRVEIDPGHPCPLRGQVQSQGPTDPTRYPGDDHPDRRVAIAYPLGVTGPFKQGHR